MTCSVNYRGNWAPVMKWQQDEGPVITVGVVNKTVPYKSVTSSLTVLVARNVTGSKFSCTTYFSEKDKPAITNSSNTLNSMYVIVYAGASNVLDFNYTWTSKFINVTSSNDDGKSALSYSYNYRF